MDIKSFNEKLEFSDNRIVTEVILETSFSKEIRILLKNGQIMKEHKAPFPNCSSYFRRNNRLWSKRKNKVS